MEVVILKCEIVGELKKVIDVNSSAQQQRVAIPMQSTLQAQPPRKSQLVQTYGSSLNTDSGSP